MLSIGRYTNRLHLRASCLEATLEGVLVTSDVVARKAFGASQTALVLLTMAPAVANGLAVFVAALLRSVERRRLFLGAGVFGRLGMLLVAFAVPPSLLPIFVIAILMYALAQTVTIPALNAIFQANYSYRTRGRLFSRAATVAATVTAACSVGAGFLLDHHPGAYRLLYPAAGVIAFGGCLIWGRIRVRRMRGAAVPLAPAAGQGDWLLGPGWFRRILELLRRHRRFRDFEVGYFLYGVGFMMLQPVFARFFVDDLGLGYGQAAAVKGAAFYLAYIVALPPMGRLLDRIGIPLLTAACFANLTLFALALTQVRSFPAAMACHAYLGACMAGVSLTWNLGPPYFARNRDSSRYMSVHVSLVGLRALLGHPLGGLIASFHGPRATFAAASVMFLLGALAMLRVARQPEEA